MMGLTWSSFDEVHFGGFAMKYIRRKFFMGRAPSTGKTLGHFERVGRWVRREI